MVATTSALPRLRRFPGVLVSRPAIDRRALAIPALIVVVGVFVYAVLQAQLVSDGFKAARVEAQLRTATARYGALRSELSKASSPTTLESRLGEFGLEIDAKPTFLVAPRGLPTTSAQSEPYQAKSLLTEPG